MSRYVDPPCDLTPMQAGRIFYRILIPIADAIDAASDADAEVDGGEWSAKWHDNQYDEEYDRIVNMLARGFRWQVDDVLDAIHLYDVACWSYDPFYLSF